MAKNGLSWSNAQPSAERLINFQNSGFFGAPVRTFDYSHQIGGPLSGRRQAPLPAEDGSPLVAMASELRRLRAQKNNPTYEVMGKKIGYRASAFTAVFSGKRFPAYDLVEAVVGYLGDEGDKRRVLDLWHQAHAAQEAERVRSDSLIALRRELAQARSEHQRHLDECEIPLAVMEQLRLARAEAEKSTRVANEAQVHLESVLELANARLTDAGDAARQVAERARQAALDGERHAHNVIRAAEARAALIVESAEGDASRLIRDATDAARREADLLIQAARKESNERRQAVAVELDRTRAEIRALGMEAEEDRASASTMRTQAERELESARSRANRISREARVEIYSLIVRIGSGLEARGLTDASDELLSLLAEFGISQPEESELSFAAGRRRRESPVFIGSPRPDGGVERLSG